MAHRAAPVRKRGRIVHFLTGEAPRSGPIDDQRRPDQIAAYLESDNVTLAGADAWLAETISSEGDAFSDQLRMLKLPAMLDDLLNVQDVARRADSDEGLALG